MTECLSDNDVLELSQASLDSFEERLGKIPHELRTAFQEEARRLEIELLAVYRVIVLCSKREESLERVSQWWGTMVQVCDNFAARLNELVSLHPDCGAEQYYDRVLELRNKCLRLQKMHT